MLEPLRDARQYHTLSRPLPLWGGGALASVTIAYETWGTLSPARDNVVLVLHALTGDSHAADPHDPDNAKAAWWNPLIGPGRAFDTNRYLVICSNVIGGCQGTTGPSSVNPETGVPYATDFPLVTVQDMVRAQREMLTELGIHRLAAVAGGSIGGMQALEWAVRFPSAVDTALLFGATERIGPQAIGFNAIGRGAIMLDPAWCDGRYEPGNGPDTGLQLARMVGMMTYQSAQGQWLRFGREPASRPASVSPLGEKFDIEGYLEYQGRSLARRFDANSYLYLTRAMDLYDVADGWNSERAALDRIRARTLHVGMSTDWLYPPEQVRALAEKLRALGKDAVYTELASVHGHDAFLKEWTDMAYIIGEYLAEPRTVPQTEGVCEQAATPAQAS